MRNLSGLEINCISGGEPTIVIAGCIAVIAVEMALMFYGMINYNKSLDFSNMTAEEAYQKGLEDGYGYASLSIN